MSAEWLLSTIGLLFACFSLAKIYLHDFVVGQELASLLHHRLLIIAEKTQHARGLTILYPWYVSYTHLTLPTKRIVYISVVAVT